MFCAKNTGVGSLSLLQGIFPIQELNWGLLHFRQILYQLSYQGSPLTEKKSCQNVLYLSLKGVCPGERRHSLKLNSFSNCFMKD